MSLKLKALGLSLVAAMAVSAVAVMSASAKDGGHFVTTGNTHTTIEAHVDSKTPLHLKIHGLSGEVGCATQTHHGTNVTETFTSITITPTYTGCTTTGTETSVPVDVNGCTYTFTVNGPITTPENPPGSNTVEHTAHLVCPAGAAIKVTHPNCTVTVHPQTVNGGITYTTETNAQNIHDIKMHVNVQFTVTKHGLCQFVSPTNGNGTLIGTPTVTAKNTAGDQVHLTAT